MSRLIQRRSILAQAGALTAGMALSKQAWAQHSWPNGPIKFVHGYPAGQTPDILARQIAPNLSEQSGVPWVVDPRPGGGERLAANQMAQMAKQLNENEKLDGEQFDGQ